MELQIFSNSEFGEIRSVEKENKGTYLGFFYALEYGDLVKIGSTKNPYQRLLTLKREAASYNNSRIGRFALSKPQTNYTKNEKILHKVFASCRKSGTELFDISFNEVINNDIELEYKDETESIKNKSEKFLDMMKGFMLGGA
jgi:hypothetical protein